MSLIFFTLCSTEEWKQILSEEFYHETNYLWSNKNSIYGIQREAVILNIKFAHPSEAISYFYIDNIKMNFSLIFWNNFHFSPHYQRKLLNNPTTMYLALDWWRQRRSLAKLHLHFRFVKWFLVQICTLFVKKRMLQLLKALFPRSLHLNHDTPFSLSSLESEKYPSCLPNWPLCEHV